MIRVPELFKAYPELEHVAVVFKPMVGARGQYNPNTRELTIDHNASASSLLSTILHETQHAVQFSEGFPAGGSPSQFKHNPRRANDEKIDKLQNKLSAMFTNAPEAFQKLIRINNQEINKAQIEDKTYDEKRRLDTVDELQKKFPDLFFDLDPETAYRRLAGEVEARNVQYRNYMTPEERAKTPLSESEDVPRDEQILKNVSPLDSETESLLIEYTAGQILKGLDYKSVIAILNDLGGDAQSIHAQAVAQVRGSGMTESAKQKLKTRSEHYREADKYAKHIPSLSGIAQDAEAKGKSKELVFAVDRLTGDKPKTINGVIGDVAKKFNLSIEKATEIVRDAKILVREIKSERQAKADEKKGITKELRAEMGRAKVAKARATYKLNKMFAQMATTPNLIKRFNNDFRAKLVNNWFTQAFNAVQGGVMTGFETLALDPIEQGIATLQGKKPGTERQWKDTILPLAYIFSTNRQAAELALSEFPEEYFRVHTGLFGDIEIEPRRIAEDKTGLSKIAHKWFDWNDSVVNPWLSKVSGAKAQELHFRYAIINGVFDQIIRAKSKGTETLKSAEDNSTLAKYITETDAKRAVDKALRVTYASEMDTPTAKKLKHAYDKLDSILPVLLNPVTFARFTYTTTRGMVLNPLIFGALDGKDYSTRSFAKGVTAWSGVVAAYVLMGAFGDDDDKWYTLTVNGTTYDVRRWFPASSYFYVAHVIRSMKEGRPLPTPTELLGGFASLETEYFQYGAAFQFATEDVPKAYMEQDLDPLGRGASRLVGSYFAGMLRFFKPMKDALAQLDKDEATIRDYDDTAKDQFIKEVSKSLPVVSRWTKPQTDAVTGEPIVAKAPLARAIGINVVHPSFMQAKESPATEWANRLFTFTPDGEWTADEKRAFYIRKRLLNAVRRGEVKPGDLDGRIDQLVKEGKLTPKSAKTLRDNLTLSELAYKLKYSYKPGKEKRDEKQDKKLQKVLSVATEEEKKEIQQVIGNRMK
jgi:polyhydroxyalkanoate synthesis regulator phasin